MGFGPYESISILESGSKLSCYLHNQDDEMDLPEVLELMGVVAVPHFFLHTCTLLKGEIFRSS